jgi:hypothetical protein
MIYHTISIKGSIDFQLNGASIIDLRKSYIAQFPEFLLDNIRVYERHTLLNDTTTIETTTLYNIIIAPIIH